MGRTVTKAFTEMNAPHEAVDFAHRLDKYSMPGAGDRRDIGCMAAVRVLLVDDHELFRVGLRELLEEEGFEVDDAESGEAAVRRCPTFRPDVVVMDMNMPGMSGIEATRHVLDAHAHAAVLMLTVAADDERVLEAIRAGAIGYLLKEARLPEIVAGVKAAASGRSPIGPGVAGALVASVREGGGRPSSCSPSPPTTRVCSRRSAPGRPATCSRRRGFPRSSPG